MEEIKKAKKDMLDLEAITRNIEVEYKPLNIELTSYEQEQENNAIISYEELLSNRDNNKVNYDSSFENNVDVDVRKVSLKSVVPTEPMVSETSMEVTLMSYEKEEAFLKALKQLQIDLAR